MVEIIILNSKQIQKIKPSIPYIVISISDKKDKFQPLKFNWKCKGVLRLKYSDSENDEKIITSKTCKGIFINQHVKKILDFIEKHKRHTELVIINYSVNIIKNATLAYTLYKVYDINDDYFHKHYKINRILHGQILKECEIYGKGKNRKRTT